MHEFKGLSIHYMSHHSLQLSLSPLLFFFTYYIHFFLHALQFLLLLHLFLLLLVHVSIHLKHVVRVLDADSNWQNIHTQTFMEGIYLSGGLTFLMIGIPNVVCFSISAVCSSKALCIICEYVTTQTAHA